MMLSINFDDENKDDNNDEYEIKKNHLDKLKDFCNNFIVEKDKNQYVYKNCSNCIVIMKKLPDTQTNEDRQDVKDMNYAKFRADKLFVVAIVTVAPDRNLTSIDSIKNDNYATTILYKIDTVVQPNNYDPDKNKVCSS